MNVAMRGQRPDSLFIPESDALPLLNFSDAGEGDFREAFPPRIQNQDGIPARHREQELEILPVGQCSQQWGLGRRLTFSKAARFTADGNGGGEEFSPNPAGVKEVAQVSR